MSDLPPIIINLGELTRPGTVLIEKISDFIGTRYEPSRILKEAQALAQAEEVSTVSKIRIDQIRARAANRIDNEAAWHQLNIETAVANALPNLIESATPNEIDTDWLYDFFAKCKCVSDEDMLSIWSRILAEEANSPGSISKRTMYTLSILDKKEAMVFNKCSNFSDNDFEQFLIFDLNDSIYKNNGVTDQDIRILEHAGLLHHAPLGFHQAFTKDEIEDNIVKFKVGKKQFTASFPSDNERKFIPIGHYIFTQTAEELRKLVTPTSPSQFGEYVFHQVLKRLGSQSETKITID